MFSLREIFFQPLKCQPNINTLRVHRNPITGTQQIILIGLDGCGFIVEYIPISNEWKTCPISISEVQPDCRVLSIEILPISKYNATPSIIYGYAKTTGISNNDECNNFFFDRLQIVDNNVKPLVLSRAIPFAPKFMKLLVIQNPSNSEKESILVISGTEKILFFAEKNERSLQDVTKTIDQYLPELKQLTGNVCAIDMMTVTNPGTGQMKRLIACGHANGVLHFHQTEIGPDGTLKTNFELLEYDSFISSVKFFYHNRRPNENEQPHLLVTSALEPAVIYRNVFVQKLNDPMVLVGTESQDCLTCSSIGDIDLDGKNEILLGTFGKVVFICRLPIDDSKSTDSPGLTFTGEIFPVCRVLPLAASAFGLITTDLTNDDLSELIIATTRGLHIHQLDLNEVTKLIETRLKKKTNSV